MAFEYVAQQMQGPQISVSLFGDAAARGVQVGQATPSTLSSIVSGVQQGINNSIAINKSLDESKLAAQQRELTQKKIDSYERENEVESAYKEALAAKLKQDIADAPVDTKYKEALIKQTESNAEMSFVNKQIKDLELETAKVTQAVNIELAAKEAATKKAKADQVLLDIQASNALSKYDSLDVQNKVGLLQHPTVSDYLARNPQEATSWWTKVYTDSSMPYDIRKQAEYLAQNNKMIIRKQELQEDTAKQIAVLKQKRDSYNATPETIAALSEVPLDKISKVTFESANTIELLEDGKTINRMAKKSATPTVIRDEHAGYYAVLGNTVVGKIQGSDSAKILKDAQSYVGLHKAYDTAVGSFDSIGIEDTEDGALAKTKIGESTKPSNINLTPEVQQQIKVKNDTYKALTKDLGYSPEEARTLMQEEAKGVKPTRSTALYGEVSPLVGTVQAGGYTEKQVELATKRGTELANTMLNILNTVGTDPKAKEMVKQWMQRNDVSPDDRDSVTKAVIKEQLSNTQSKLKYFATEREKTREIIAGKTAKQAVSYPQPKVSLSASEISQNISALEQANAYTVKLKKQNAAKERRTEAQPSETALPANDEESELVTVEEIQYKIGASDNDAKVVAKILNSPYFDYIDNLTLKRNKYSPLTLAIAAQESGGNTQAKSPTGPYGLMQLTERTSKSHGYNRRDPYQNVAAGDAEIKKLLRVYNQDKNLALAAYNGGIGTINSAINIAKSSGHIQEDTDKDSYWSIIKQPEVLFKAIIKHKDALFNKAPSSYDIVQKYLEISEYPIKVQNWEDKIKTTMRKVIAPKNKNKRIEELYMLQQNEVI